MNRRRIALGISAVGGVAALAAGISSIAFSTTPAPVRLGLDPVGAVRAAGTATAESGTAQVDTVVTKSMPAVPAKGTVAGAAAMTTTTHGAGLFDFGRQIGEVNLTTDKGQLQEVLTPSSLFLRAGGPAEAGLPAGKGWSRFDVGRLPDGNLVIGGSPAPAMTFAMLAGVAADVKYVGQDDVRDTAVAHYQGTIDLAEAASAPVPTGNAAAAADKKALTNASHAFTTQIPFDAYLDGQGRLRRFVARFEFTVPGPAHTRAEVTSATELYSFGVPVDVTVPVPTAPPAAPTPTVSSAFPAPARRPVSPVRTTQK